MPSRVLITGGAGFIGSHVTDELLRNGYSVRILDNLDPQVHGKSRRRPDYLDRRAELIVGDVRDADAVRRALDGVDLVLHLAASVGVGQSMYEIARYTSVNNLGTAILLEALIDRPVRRLVVASSMSIYGEGLYRDPAGHLVQDADRSLSDLGSAHWEPRVNGNGRHIRPIPTPEWKQPSLASVYALSKYDQERLCLMIGRAHHIPAVALRFFNVYGPRQALSNPYTGVLAIFASRILNDRPPLIYEDGRQMRDFVSVYDVARACRLALESDAADVVVNIGSGRPVNIREVASRMAAAMNRPDIVPHITGKYRCGDIRHCFADIARARDVLQYQPQVSFEDGLADLAGWLSSQQAEDRAETAQAELAARGLTV